MLSLLRHFLNETKQICASHTKRGCAMGCKFDIKSTYKTKLQLEKSQISSISKEAQTLMHTILLSMVLNFQSSPMLMPVNALGSSVK